MAEAAEKTEEVEEPVPTRFYTPKAAERRLGVCTKTLTRWADKGVIKYWKTPGGHRRYDIDSLKRI